MEACIEARFWPTDDTPRAFTDKYNRIKAGFKEVISPKINSWAKRSIACLSVCMQLRN